MIKVQDIIDYFNQIIADPELSSNVNPRDIADIHACVYQDGNGHHCLVGHWLHHFAGVDDEWMNEHIEGRPADTAIEEVLHFGFFEDNISFDAINALHTAQLYADKIDDGQFATWGEAAEKALSDIDLEAARYREEGW